MRACVCRGTATGTMILCFGRVGEIRGATLSVRLIRRGGLSLLLLVGRSSHGR